MTAAAFQATYSDWRIIKGRKVVQVVLELPIEKADEAYQVLGGMPIAANEIWCAVARLKGGDATDQGQKEVPNSSIAETKPRPVQSPGSAGAEKVRRSFDEMSPAQQAGMLSNERAFQRFLEEKYSDNWYRNVTVPDVCPYPAEVAASTVRDLCQVMSRRELNQRTAEWTDLVRAYRLWQREAEVVPA